MVDRPLQAQDQGAQVGGAARPRHLDRHQVGAGRLARVLPVRRGTVAGDQAGHERAVAVAVLERVVPAGQVDAADQAAGEVGQVVDAGVEHGHGDALAGVAAGGQLGGPGLLAGTRPRGCAARSTRSTDWTLTETSGVTVMPGSASRTGSRIVGIDRLDPVDDVELTSGRCRRRRSTAVTGLSSPVAVTMTVSLWLADAAGAPAIEVPARVAATAAPAATARPFCHRMDRARRPKLTPNETIRHIWQPLPMGAFLTYPPYADGGRICGQFH